LAGNGTAVETAAPVLGSMEEPDETVGKRAGTKSFYKNPAE
jgi:hypothetical protein